MNAMKGLMVDILAQEKGDDIWKIYGPALKKEYNFWMDGEDKLQAEGDRFRRVVKMSDGSVLNFYSDEETGARSESYKEDSKIAKDSERNTDDVYPHIRAACESGWDFSTRWFADKKNIHTIRCGDILPVDLNALLYCLEVKLVKVCELEGDEKGAEEYRRRAERRKEAVNKYFWDENTEFFYDYDLVEKKIMNDIPTLAAPFPLFFNMVDSAKAESVAKRLEKDFLRSGGLVTTLNYSNQQWDAPNGWAPLQWVSIKGLMNYGFDKLAKEVRRRWVKLNEDVFNPSRWQITTEMSI